MKDNNFKKNFMASFISEALKINRKHLSKDLELIQESDVIPCDFMLDILDDNNFYIIVRLNKYDIIKDEIIPIYYWKYRLNNKRYKKLAPLTILELNNFDIKEVIKKRKIVDK
jgi:hypothetical protein